MRVESVSGRKKLVIGPTDIHNQQRIRDLNYSMKLVSRQQVGFDGTVLRPSLQTTNPCIYPLHVPDLTNIPDHLLSPPTHQQLLEQYSRNFGDEDCHEIDPSGRDPSAQVLHDIEQLSKDVENYNVSLQTQAEDDYKRTDDYKRNLQTDHFRSSWVGNNPGGAGPDLAGLTQQAQAAASATLSAVLQQLPNLEHVHPLLSKQNKMGWEQLALSGGSIAFESILGFEIDGPDKLLVEILEAKELRPIVQGKTENVFCQIYLRSKDHHWSRSRLRAMLPSHTTSQVQ